MSELMYTKSSVMIALTLLVLMVLAIRIGHHLGARSTSIKNCAPCKEHISTLLSSVLGMLALMLGFSFSIALERHSSRSEAVVDESNAIGTAYMRVALLPQAEQAELQDLFARYLQVRLDESKLTLAQAAVRETLNQNTNQLQMQLWNKAMKVAAADPNPVRVGLFVQALNEMIDAYGKRYAELNRHIPELVLLLLYGALIISGGMLGYSAGVSEHKPSNAVFVMLSLVVLLMYVVIDLDRPRRGLIVINQAPMESLRTMMK
ncbi:MAG: hypothetical protein Q8R74_11900 [Methylophilus sp.]|nr:hypothetical protein [Methylophilus sp.]